MTPQFEEKISLISKDRNDINFYLPNISKDWIIGFIEAEGGFYGSGRHIIFSISQHLSDWYLLLAIRDFLGVGKIVPSLRNDGRLSAELVINNRSTIESVIIPLISNQIRTTKKLDQFNNWIKEHFNLPPTIKNSVITPGWVAGFVDGDGSFFIKISKSSSHKCGHNIRAAFDITQVSSEKNLLISIADSFFGGIYHLTNNSLHMAITNFSVHKKYVEPFLN